MRRELLEAYLNSVGGHGIERKGPEPTISGVFHAGITEEELDRFLKHGIANVSLPRDFSKVAFLVDIAALPSKATGYWLTPGKDQLTLHLSNGRTEQKEAIKFAKGRYPEGFFIITDPHSTNALNNEYTARAIPLYPRQ